MPWKTMKSYLSDIVALDYVNFSLIFARNPYEIDKFCPRCQNLKGVLGIFYAYVKENKNEATSMCVFRVLQGFQRKQSTHYLSFENVKFCLQSYFPDKNVLQVHNQKKIFVNAMICISFRFHIPSIFPTTTSNQTLYITSTTGAREIFEAY